MNAFVPTKPPDTKITNSNRKIQADACPSGQNCNSKLKIPPLDLAVFNSAL
jgi:hypothetical protein